MFGKVNFEFPRIDARFVDLVRVAMIDAESILPGKGGAEKKAWVKDKVKDAAKSIDLKKVPSFLEDPIRDALISVVVDVVWALAFKKKED